ncbi:MAG: Lsa family ABC-F type ribosomal protection protein [Clostridium sp.]|jgi:lincosamide and streptogramin A transport system ATP-binding/permease protein|uniref:Lsa family ABC-F type ribosomal protection protein n=1 Tax=Clostridium sp. TaxID=1506 RepID=UPI0025C254DD|nr:Lsa family ABC-F type ribosomal protection protein [Clostridium sp.]MCH3964481.1 Lsa family ABC-F type ribosomal protection protein [Clostridium sp.]MCI1714953.1 Lsa family ABC-F type ribosomal protection protein [Clostridium sp.]MCI1799215.1 Lsa family ABC-F type ribosomal protection protein [Clostridium sp.]MCI1813136.1 Lsa family ABC-F type ribosomal protection protein [Clostridium sp.]MCI1870026.1 Lsa family ABC-F type ribosomal protection protein [Clostridium sp.]
MSLINVTNLTFAYEGSYDNIFENVGFQIDTNWKLGFTGRNGRGKTTFLNLLLGKYEYNGNISADVTFEYFPYKVNEQENFAIDIIREISPNSMDWEIIKELSLLDMDSDALYRQFYTLSKGEQTKVLLAAMFLKENSFLLIDEPTNHLDAQARKKLSNYLKKKKGFILISHDRYFLDNCIDHILAINKSNIEIQKGNFSSWWRNKELQDGFELAENERLKKDISWLSSSAKRTSAWSNSVESSKYGTTNSGSKLDKGYVGHKAAKMMKRAKNIEARQQNMIEEKSRLLKNIESNESLKIAPLTFHDKKLVELADLSIQYDNRIVCEAVSFTIEQGERIAIQGKNGSGKSSILKLIYGEDIPYNGIVRKNRQLIISYVSQDTSDLYGNLSEYAEKYCIEESLFKSILRKLDFSREQFEKNIEDFSGGQKKKVLIAKSLCEQAHLYIWDEPLNFIDVISRMQIEQLLIEYQPTILFVEHDIAFCENVATKIIKL